MSSFRRTTPCWLIVQTLCFCLLLQGSGIAHALPLPPKPTFVSKDDLDAARLRRAAAGAEDAKPGLLKRFAGDAAAAGSRIQGWLNDAWAPASSAASPEAPLWIAQAGGTLPLPSRLMPAVLAVPLQGQGAPPGPPSRAGAQIEATPAAEAAKLLEKAGTGEIPLVAGWNLVSIPLEPADPDPAVVFAPIAGQLLEVAHVDVCDAADPEKIYDPADPAGSDLTAVTPGMGLWVKISAATLLPLTGTLPAATTIELCPGWNHLGLPTGQPRHPYVALSSIAGKWQRVFGHDAFDAEDPWEYFDPVVPAWANDMTAMRPGYGYWVLASEAATLEIRNQGPPPTVALAAPADLAVVTQPTQVTGTVDSDRLESWTLTSRPIGGGEPVTLATGTVPVSSAAFANFDPTLLLNGLYELELTATDVQGQRVTESVSVSVEGQMKIGHFTLSFVDLAIPVSGLDIEIVRTYDSRDKQLRDFGVGWSLDVRQGSYVNNRPPGDGWQLQTGFVPCDTVIESKSHLTVVRLSDQEVYRFALRLQDGAPTGGGCFATARFDYVDGPLPGSTLEILGNTSVFWANGSDEVIDANSFELYEPQDVKLTTRDGRIFELDLDDGVSKLEDLNGNQLKITPAGISHSSGKSIAFVRDTEGRITQITDPLGQQMSYVYDSAGDLIRFSDRADADTHFTYDGNHLVLNVENALGIKPIRNEYDAEGRLVRHIDAGGRVTEISHDLDSRREIVTNRLGLSRILEYNARGNVIRETDEAGEVTTRTYDGRDNLLTETDSLGRTTTYTYTVADEVAAVTDPMGQVTRFTYDDRGRMLTLKDPLGHEITYSYDARGNLMQTVDAAGHIADLVYDSQGQLQAISNAAGTTQLEYDAHGNQIRFTDPLSHATASTYDANGRRLTMTQTRTLPDGASETLTTSEVYDALGKVVMITAPDGSTITTTYDAVGRVTSRMDALGRTTSMTYDAVGHLITRSYPDGTQESWIRDAEGRVISQIDRSGRTTSFTRDPLGRILTTTSPDGGEVINLYDAAGQLVGVTNARGHTTTFTYDDAGRRTAVIDALGNGPVFTYDANGRLSSVRNNRGFTTSFSYDDLGRHTGTTFPDGTTTASTYDSLGRQTSFTDQNSAITTFGYDAVGRLASVTDALEQVTSYSYDEVGNQISQVDALGRVTRFEYDAVGARTRRILPDGATESYGYNADGTLATHTDFKGATRTFEYDSSQRLVGRGYPDGSQVSFTYTASGQRATATDDRGTTAYTYDALDRLIEKQDPAGYRLSYTYDLQGNRTSLTATVGSQAVVTTYSYDPLDRLTTVTDPQGEVTTLSYDENGNRTDLAFPNDVTTSRAYDPLDRLSGVTASNGAGEVLQGHAYVLDPAGNRVRVDEADGASRQYAYDALYRLTRETVHSATAALVYQKDFAYDPVGNRLQQTTQDDNGTTTVSSTHDSRDRLLGALAFYEWDDNGNLARRTGSETTDWEWDFENRLESIVFSSGTEIRTVYDVDGNRVRTETTLADGSFSTVDYLVDPSGPLSHVVAEITDQQIATLYVRAHDRLLSLYRPAGGGKRFFHVDGLGSVIALSDSAGTVTDRYAYTTFGELLEHTGNDPNPYLFAGEPFEPTSGLYYNRARWLDPSTGRFVSADSFEGEPLEPLSLHKYTYAHDNPVNHVDPTGRSIGGVADAVMTLAIRGTVLAIAFGAIGYTFARLRGMSHAQAWKQAKQSGGIGFLFAVPYLGAGLAVYFLGGFIWAALNGKLEALDYWEVATYVVVGLALRQFNPAFLRSAAKGSKPLQLPPGPEPPPNPPARVWTALERGSAFPEGVQGTSPRAGDFTGLRGADPLTVLERIPADWPAQSQGSGQGVRFRHPTDLTTSIRISNGNPHAPYIHNRGPYLRILRRGTYLDSDGVPQPNNRTAAGHIPLKGNPGL